MQACNSTVVAKRLLDPQFSHVCGNAHAHKLCSTQEKPNMRSDLAEEGGGAIQCCVDANWQVINSNSYGMKLYTCARWMQVLGFLFS